MQSKVEKNDSETISVDSSNIYRRGERIVVERSKNVSKRFVYARNNCFDMSQNVGLIALISREFLRQRDVNCLCAINFVVFVPRFRSSREA